MMKLVCVFVALHICLAATEIFKDKNVQEAVRDTVAEYNAQNTSIGDTLIQKSYKGEMEVNLKFAPGIVSQKCLKCICLKESGCRKTGCKVDVGSLSCGYFQIKETYWIDCGRPGGDWKRCADDITCSSQCVQNYMKRYATYYHCPLNCEGFAREHNGGPRGCKSPFTIGYWNAIQKIKGCHGVQLK